MANRPLVRPSFLRSVLILAGGSTIAQALPIAISPLLTRLYTPEDFGLFALFMAIISIFGGIATGRYELAILLPDSTREALQVLVVGLLCALGTTAVLTLVVTIFGLAFSKTIGNPLIYPWLYLAPPIVLLTALFTSLTYYNNRITHYADIARANVWKSVALCFSQVSIGFIHPGAAGLFIGQALSVVTANFRLYRNVAPSLRDNSIFIQRDICALAYRYRNFPYFSMPAALANTLTQQLAVFFISGFFSPSLLGFYFLAQRVLGMPATLVGASVSQVFFQRIASVRYRHPTARRIFDRTTWTLASVSAPVFLILYFVSEPLFALFFGADWRPAGRYAAILMPLFYIRFVVTAVSTTTSAYEKQYLALLWQLTLLLLSLSCMAITYQYKLSFESFLRLYTVTIGAHYLVLYALLRMIVSKQN